MIIGKYQVRHTVVYPRSLYLTKYAYCFSS